MLRQRQEILTCAGCFFLSLAVLGDLEQQGLAIAGHARGVVCLDVAAQDFLGERIFQETLTNIVRHAGASRVDVRLAESEGQLVLTVRDNGRGISEREINGASIGLIGMRERAAQVGGVVFFFGLPMQGTTVTMRAPLVPPTLLPKTGAPT